MNVGCGCNDSIYPIMLILNARNILLNVSIVALKEFVNLLQKHLVKSVLNFHCLVLMDVEFIKFHVKI